MRSFPGRRNTHDSFICYPRLTSLVFFTSWFRQVRLHRRRLRLGGCGTTRRRPIDKPGSARTGSKPIAGTTAPRHRSTHAAFDDEAGRIRGPENSCRAARQVSAAAGGWRTCTGGRRTSLVAKSARNTPVLHPRRAAGSVARDITKARWILNDLCQFCARRRPQLKKTHIATWIGSHPSWKSPTTHRSVITVVLAAFNYAAQNHDLPNPLKGLKKPAARPRLYSLTPDEEQAVYGAADAPFRDFLFAALHTGLRPFCELARLTTDDVVETERGMMWRVYSSKTKKTRKIPVRPEVAALSLRLIATAPRGSGVPLFRNPQGNLWKKVTGVSRFLAIKRLLGWDQDKVRQKYSSYTCRHTFAHRMLSGYWNGGAGCSIETLAELIGDTPKVAFDHYGKEWGQHYQEPLWAALGAAPQARPKPSKKGAAKDRTGAPQPRQRRRA